MLSESVTCSWIDAFVSTSSCLQTGIIRCILLIRTVTFSLSLISLISLLHSPYLSSRFSHCYILPISHSEMWDKTCGNSKVMYAVTKISQEENMKGADVRLLALLL